MNCAPMPSKVPSESAVSDDAVLDGRLLLQQPVRGHRVGHDAILLAAATAATKGEHAVDLGAGIGAAGLALASRVDGLRVTLVDIDPGLTAMAARNAARNGLASRVNAIRLDVELPARAFAAAGLKPGSADRVLMNPPFHDSARQKSSPHAGRRLAHVGSPELTENLDRRCGAASFSARGTDSDLARRWAGRRDHVIGPRLRRRGGDAGAPKSGRSRHPHIGARREAKPRAANDLSWAGT